MSYNNFLSIDGNTITIQNINTNDVWNITVIDANFMLSKYNGRGTDSVNIIPFPNIGDGIYGDIVLSINNNPCYKGSVENAEGDGKYFDVSPKYVTLKGKGDTYIVSVASPSSCDWSANTESNEFTYTEDKTKGTITIISDSEGSFENLRLTVTNCEELVETVYVSQKPSQDDPKLLTVNPQYITLSGDEKEFKINVISMCSGNTAYTYDESVEGITLNDDGNFIYGTITSTEKIEGRTFTVSNDCGSKTVTVNYSLTDESSHYMWIKESGTTAVTTAVTTSVTSVFDSVEKELICEIDSSSNWYIYSYDSTKVKCSKTVIEGNSNCIKITLGEDKSKCDNYEIILRNRDNDEVKVIYSIEDGLVFESGVTFTFATGNTVHETSTITQNSSNDEITFNICVLCYDSDNNPVKWSVKSSAFITTETDLKGGVSGSCKTVTLKATESTKKSKSTNYTIKLQEQETFKEITVKVVIDRPESETNSSYHIEMYPEDGSTYSMSEMDDFQISVTPSYIYNGSTYYIGNNDAMSSNSSYRGVSAKTESKTEGVSLALLNGSDVYDTLIYKVNITNTELESFEICSTAYTKDNEATETTVCSTINLTAHTVEVICDFTTGETTIEVSGGAQTFEVFLMSRKDGEVVPLNYSGVTDWITVRQDEYGEKIFLTFTENSDFDERKTIITVTQNDGCDKGNYIINIVQYSNQTIFIPDFDYIVVRYFWEPAAGVDLDTVTVIPYLINNDGTTNTDTSKYPYIGKGVGWSHNDTVSNASGGVYIAHAGDNRANGNECVYIDFENICSSEEQIENMMREGIRKIRVDLYGNWYSSKGTGLLDVSLITYKGGEMEKDSANYNFINETGTITYDKKHSSKVCTQGGDRASKYNQGQDVGYTNIGYIEYDITNGNAILTLNAECADDRYDLSNNLSTTSLTIDYSYSTENSVKFTSTKNNNFFSGVSITSTQSWLKDFVTNSTSNPIIYTYTVDENTTSSERLGKIIITQNESGKLLEYQIRQQVNSATFFSLSETEELREQEITLEEEQTTLRISVLSCKNYNNGNGNRLDYESSVTPCGTSGTKDEEGDYKFFHTFNIPKTCGSGSIVLTQDETNNQITINFNRTCSCQSQETINATVTLSSGEKYVENGSYYFNITATAVLNKIIECGSATVTVYYGVGIIDNASYSEILIPKNSKSGTVTNVLTIGVTDEYDENFAMDCIHSSREGSVITFTNNSCYVAGVVTINVKSDSLCQACNCEVISVSVTPSNYSFMENEEQIFTLKVETSSCDSCTKGYKFYDPTGRLVTAGTSENTVKLSYNNIIEGDYELISDDDNTKIAYLTVGKTANEYEIYATGTTIDPLAVEAYVTITSLKNGNPYSDIMLSETCNWVTSYNKVSSSNGTYQYQIVTLPNETTSSRTCTVTVSQEGGESTTFDIVQEGTTPPPPPPEPQCMTVNYTVSEGVNCDVYFNTTNGTQQGSHSNVSSNGSKELCNIAEDTELKVVCSCGDVTVGGDTTFTYKGGESINISLSKNNTNNCSTIGISCYPNQVTSGGTKFVNNGARTTITVTGGTTNKWSVISSPDNDNLTSNNTGTTYIGYKFGTYTIQSDECPRKTCTFKILEPEITGIHIANNQPGVAKIYKTTQATGKVLLGELSNRGDEQLFPVTFDDHGSLDIEYAANQWCQGGGCFVHITVKGDNLTQIGNPTENGVSVNGETDGAMISAQMNGSCSGGFTTASGYYTVNINVKYADYPCTNC